MRACLLSAVFVLLFALSCWSGQIKADLITPIQGPVNNATITLALDGASTVSAFLDGSDWAAKTNSAIAALPPGGGTVFVPAFLAGSASTALTIPSNVSVLFDAGTFSTSSTITFSGSGNRVQGVPNATILSFTGATDGFIVADNATLGKYIVIDGFRLQTTSAAGSRPSSWMAP